MMVKIKKDNFIFIFNYLINQNKGLIDMNTPQSLHIMR
jgi:hypothetical protein